MRYDPKWENIIKPVLVGTGIELIGVVKVGGGHKAIMRVYLDRPGGITIDDIAKLSKEIEMVLGVEMDSRDYTLEVSSPGLDRPLFTPAHFQQQIGKQVKVKLGILKDNRKHFSGILQAATEDAITIVVDEEPVIFPYSEIDNAHLIVDIEFGKKGHK